MRLSKLLLFSFLFTQFLLCSQDNSLVIFSSSGSPFLLSVNHQKINALAQSNVKVFNLSIGWHYLQLHFKHNENEIIFTDSIKFSDIDKYKGKEFTYAFIDSNKKFKLQFLSVSESSAIIPPYIPEAPKEKAPMVDNSLYGKLYQAKNNKPVFFDNYNQDTETCEHALTEQEMSYTINLLKKNNDLEAKSRYAKQIIEKNCYTCQQVNMILNELTIEIEKLNLAKIAYSHVSDKQNLALITSTFNYKSIKQSYQDFLTEQKNFEIQKAKGCKEPMPQSKFDLLCQKIKHTNYDHEKVNELKKQLVNVCVSTNQLIKLSTFFNHDREKIDLFKSAYYSVIDKDNFKSLEQELQFSESKQDFNKLILKLK